MAGKQWVCSVLVTEEATEIPLTGVAELVSRKPIIGDLDPVVGHREPLSHDALVGTVQSERHLHVVGAISRNEPEDVTDLVHGLGDDALALGAGIQFQESVGRDDRTESVNCQTDAEIAVVIVEIRVGHHDVVVRPCFLPRLVVEQFQEMAAVQLMVVTTGVLRVSEIPVDAVPVGEGVALEPTRVPPDAEVVHLDCGGDARSPKDCVGGVENSLQMTLFQPLLVHEVDGTETAHLRAGIAQYAHTLLLKGQNEYYLLVYT